VLVDDLDGTVARQYTQLPNAVFVIDADGTVVFRGTVAHGPTLRRALHHLLHHGGRGRIEDDSDRMPHMLGATAFGWEAIERGGRMAVHDMWKGAPPLAANLWLGNRMKPLIGPFARRDRKIPAAVKVAAAVAAAALIIRRRRARE
ncbi:MAG: redoxin domain-containing protein, partial [Longimicrobiales bacterium]